MLNQKRKKKNFYPENINSTIFKCGMSTRKTLLALTEDQEEVPVIDTSNTGIANVVRAMDPPSGNVRSITENVRTVGSYEEFRTNVEMEEFISAKRSEAIDFFKSKVGSNLPIDLKSQDSVVINVLNTQNSDLKQAFVEQDSIAVLGSTPSKKMVAEIFKYLKSIDFRETEEGKVIYDEFSVLVSQLNAAYVRTYGSFNVNNQLLQNTLHYMLLIVPGECVSIVQLTSEISSWVAGHGINVYRPLNENVPELIRSEYVDKLKDIRDQYHADLDEQERKNYTNFYKLAINLKNGLKSVGSYIITYPFIATVKITVVGTVLGTGAYYLGPPAIKLVGHMLTFKDTDTNMVDLELVKPDLDKDRAKPIPVKEALKQLWIAILNFCYPEDSE